MKYIFTLTLFLAAYMITYAQVKPKPKDAKPEKAMKMDAGDYPYKAMYSSQFEMNKDPKNTRIILNIWKNWDDNELDKSAVHFADTVTMYLADGSVLKGKMETLEAAKKYRGSMTKATSTVHAWISTRSIDRNENWIAIWGQEEDEMADGTKSTTMIHELWRFNKDGKIDEVRHFMAKAPSQ